MRQLFYHDYTNGSQYRSNQFYSRKVHKALTYHPVKDPTTLFRLHQLFTKKTLIESQCMTKQLQEEIQELHRFYIAAD